MRDDPLLSQVFLEIGETNRLKLFALSAGDVGAGALRVRGGGPKWEHGVLLGGGSEGP